MRAGMARACRLWMSSTAVVAATALLLGSGTNTVGHNAGQVADELERWIDEGGLDGINLAYHVSPGILVFNR